MLNKGRILTLLFERDTSVDHEKGTIQYSGFRFYWPNGQPVRTALDKFCQRGVRFLFGRKGLEGTGRLLSLVCLPIDGMDAPLPELPPGIRSRRFFLLRIGQQGILHFFNGTPTDVVFEVGKDDPTVLEWIGLTQALADNARAWFDLVALPLPG